jgi:tRNA (guanine-N7-)-methyltransferase
MPSSQIPSKHRPIRSFVLRQGRITDAQARAFELHWQRYGLEFDGKPLDFDTAFGRRAPLILEIGFGNGEQLNAAALTDPDSNYLGVEVHRPGVGRLLNALAKDGIENVRVLNDDAAAVLAHGIADGALAQVRIYFPDPWPKTRHHKRRIVQHEFVALLARKLAPGGLLHLATDWIDYAEHMLAVLEASPSFRNAAGAGAYSPCPPWRRETHFERRGKRLGHGVFDLIYVRI